MARYCAKCAGGQPCPTLKHGTKVGYGYHRCRCPKCLEQKRGYYERNRDQIREYARDYRKHNRERIAEQERDHRERNREYLQRRDARKRQRRKRIPSPRNGQRWTPAEDAIVMRDDIWLTEACYMIGRSYSSVATRRRKLRRELRAAAA